LAKGKPLGLAAASTPSLARKNRSFSVGHEWRFMSHSVGSLLVELSQSLAADVCPFAQFARLIPSEGACLTPHKTYRSMIGWDSVSVEKLLQNVHPGSDGEHELQEACGTSARAEAFYRNQVLDYLNPQMQAFICRQEMMFVGTADRHGEADVSFRAGLPGFVRLLDENTLAYPEYRGNGVMASLGNISENPHVGLLFLDFTGDNIGLHVNGRARIIESGEDEASLLASESTEAASDTAGGRRPERWVVVTVVEVYIHCSKHIPRMQKIHSEVHWGTDDAVAKGGDYFKAKGSKRLQGQRTRTDLDP
jgi:uncharacterized protein